MGDLTGRGKKKARVLYRQPELKLNHEMREEIWVGCSLMMEREEGGGLERESPQG